MRPKIFNRRLLVMGASAIAVLGALAVVALSSGDVERTDPGPDRRTIVTYRVSDGQVLTVFGLPLNEGGYPNPGSGEAFLDVSGDPDVPLLWVDARAGRMNLWYVIGGDLVRR
ncbi:MAG TPA: hypothetical protein VJ400_07785 [Thermoplasmata archaeon]|nr:hypothetical protein [Thermoplasmata archaeon]